MENKLSITINIDYSSGNQTAIEINGQSVEGSAQRGAPVDVSGGAPVDVSGGAPVDVSGGAPLTSE
jgi:hypothetical protein